MAGPPAPIGASPTQPIPQAPPPPATTTTPPATTATPTAAPAATTGLSAAAPPTLPAAALQNPQTRALLDRMLGEIPALRNTPDGAQKLLDAMQQVKQQNQAGQTGQAQSKEMQQKQQRLMELESEILALQQLRDQAMQQNNPSTSAEATQELGQKIQQLAQLMGGQTDSNGSIPAQYNKNGGVQPGTGMYNTAPSYSGSSGNTSVPSGFANSPDHQQADQMLTQAANKYGIPPEILKAIAYKESRWNNGAVGDNGNSTSMMQINKAAHPDYDVQRGRQDPSYAIDYSAKFLRSLYDKYHDWGKAVEHYNGSGPAAQAYSADVMNNIAPKMANA